MPIWKLTPLDLNDPNWEASSHRGVVVSFDNLSSLDARPAMTQVNRRALEQVDLY